MPATPSGSRSCASVLEAAAAAVLDAIADPVLVLTESARVIYMNGAAQARLPQIAVGRPLFTDGDARLTGLIQALERCASSPRPLPVTLPLDEDAKVTFYPCSASRIAAPRAVLMQVKLDGELRFKGLTRIIEDLREELTEHLATQQAHADAIDERDRLLDRLREDARAREAAERERDRVLTQMYRITVEERLRLARDLHDHAGQHIMALKLGLQHLGPFIADESGRAHWSSLLGQVDAAGVDLHRVAVALRPTALEEFGLAAALSALLDEWSEATGIAGRFRTSGAAPCIASEAEVTLYRLAQEALTNVARHAAGTSAVTVELLCTDSRATLVIADDGCGFDRASEAADGGDHFGLRGMRERVALVGGHLTIASAPGRGTTIRAHVACEGEHDAG